ncbi:MAG: Sec7 domain-containing protein, partial [Terracidiphilus sp.]|nr:Sec7 domain-containing protein [Terracidiphilus sp.]
DAHRIYVLAVTWRVDVVCVCLFVLMLVFSVSASSCESSPQAFARMYCEQNRVGDGAAVDVAKDPRLYRPPTVDVAEILTFSLIMLHTDAHNPNIKKEKKMTLAQFVSNNRRVSAVLLDYCCDGFVYAGALTTRRTFRGSSWSTCTPPQ